MGVNEHTNLPSLVAGVMELSKYIPRKQDPGSVTGPLGLPKKCGGEIFSVEPWQIGPWSTPRVSLGTKIFGPKFFL